MSAQETFIQLKLFPRQAGSCVDKGHGIIMLRPRAWCEECNEPLYETVSLEYCKQCGRIETDYWYHVHV